MNHNPFFQKAASFLLFFLIAAILAPQNSPVQAATIHFKDPLAAGTYNGTIIFTLDHTYNKSAPGVPVNYYSLRGEGTGTIRFRAGENGTVSGMSIRISPIRYNVAGSQVMTVPPGSQGEYNCTGNSSYGAGVASASGGSGASGAPPLVPGEFDFFTKPIKLNPGDPWGRVSLTGKCPGKPDHKTFVNSIKIDLNSLPAEPWRFEVTWQGFQSAGGTCSVAAWSMGDRSFSCFWAAYSGGYKRKTAPSGS